MIASKILLEASPYPASLGLMVEELGEESAHFILPFKNQNSNPGKALHGGVVASMIDLGGLAVAREALGADAGPLHTASIQVSYLSAAIDQPIFVDVTLLRRGKEICHVETVVRTEEDKPIARGLSTVRGRFGKEAAEPVIAVGDDGQSEPGPMGTYVADRVPYIARLGLDFQHMTGGTSRIAMPFIDMNADDTGGVHEGAVLALLDTTGAMAAWAETGPGAFKASTVGVQASMVARPGAEDLVAYGKIAQRDDEIFWCDVEVATESSQNVVARGTVLYRIVIPKEG